MKICLVRPPSIVNAWSYIASLTPPVGVAYVAAALRVAGHDVSVVDAIGENPRRGVPIDEHLVLRGLTFAEIVDRIPEDVGLIGFSGMFSSEWVQYRNLLGEIRQARPEAFVLCGGEHFTAAAELSMGQSSAIDAVIIGEGEETVVEFVAALEAGRPLDEVAGIVFRAGAELRRTGPRPRILSVDEIVPPAWDLVPLEQYLSDRLGYGVDRGRSMPMIASRGCPYQCTFCSNPQMWGLRWIARSPKRVVDEIQGYVARYGISNVDFYDLTAIIRRDWIIEFSKELVERGLNLSWQLPSGTRCEAIDAEVAAWMYRSGCRNVNYAPESGSERTLRRVKKKVKLSKLRQSLRDAVSAGINVKLNIIIGFPHETHADILQTLLMLLRLSFAGAHDVSVGVFSPYPGSELYEQLVKEGRIAHSDEFWNSLAYVDITEAVSYSPHVSARALVLYNWAFFGLFYLSNYLFRPARIFRTLRNLALRRHESRGEMALSQLFSRIRSLRTSGRRAASIP